MYINTTNPGGTDEEWSVMCNCADMPDMHCTGTDRPDMPDMHCAGQTDQASCGERLLLLLLFFLETRQDPCSLDGSLVSLPPTA